MIVRGQDWGWSGAGNSYQEKATGNWWWKSSVSQLQWWLHEPVHELK